MVPPEYTVKVTKSREQSLKEWKKFLVVQRVVEKSKLNYVYLVWQ